MLSIIYHLFSGISLLVGLDHFISNIYCLLFYWYLEFDVLIQFLKLGICFKFISRKRNPGTLTPTQLGNVSAFLKLSLWPSTHQNTLYCVLLQCVFAYPASTNKMYPPLTFLYYLSSSSSHSYSPGIAF